MGEVGSKLVILLALILFILSCGTIPPTRTAEPANVDDRPPEVGKIIESAREQVRTARGYTQEYFVIAYPGGDVPAETGACTDVVIRSFRNAGVDLQREVHEDMATHFAAYPKKWGLNRPDTNIDHRRVPNLQTFFTRKRKSLAVSTDARAYLPGDVVSWDLDGKGMTHIGVVSDKRSQRTGRYMIIHNIGGGTNEEDRLFDWKVTGHYRYFAPPQKPATN